MSLQLIGAISSTKVFTDNDDVVTHNNENRDPPESIAAALRYLDMFLEMLWGAIDVLFVALADPAHEILGQKLKLPLGLLSSQGDVHLIAFTDPARGIVGERLTYSLGIIRGDE